MEVIIVLFAIFLLFSIAHNPENNIDWNDDPDNYWDEYDNEEDK